MPSVPAISRFDTPRTSTSRTSSSRSLSPAATSRGAASESIAAPRRRPAHGDVLGVVSATELCRLGPALVPCFLHDRGNLGVGDEALPPLRVPVEEHPDPVVLVGVAEDGRAPGAVLLALLGPLGREDLQEPV